jgi:predicted transglutaminase-like cysteine proteinase
MAPAPDQAVRHGLDSGSARLIHIVDEIGAPASRVRYGDGARELVRRLTDDAQSSGGALGARVATMVIGALSVAAWLAIVGIVAVVAACAIPPADPTLSLLGDVNSAVNRSVRYAAEPDGRNDWRVAETEGDCEDFALRKRRDLVQRGFPALDLSVLVVPGHAALLARTPGGAYVLDNRTDRIVAWDGKGREYLPLGSMWLPRDYVLKTVKGSSGTLDLAATH